MNLSTAGVRVELRSELPLPLPSRMSRLPLDRRGYPVPYFVAWIDGEPDFRVSDPRKFNECIKRHRCWLCGEALGAYLAFVAGPMCVVTRTTSEPPCHIECAEWAVRACPFLTRPKAKYRAANLPEDAKPPPGHAIMRNPGVSAVYVAKRFELFRADNGVLIRMGTPDRLSWWAEGRPATRGEIVESIDSGLPLLRAADGNNPEANAEIDRRYAAILHLLPSA